MPKRKRRQHGGRRANAGHPVTVGIVERMCIALSQSQVDKVKRWLEARSIGKSEAVRQIIDAAPETHNPQTSGGVKP